MPSAKILFPTDDTTLGRGAIKDFVVVARIKGGAAVTAEMTQINGPTIPLKSKQNPPSKCKFRKAKRGSRLVRFRFGQAAGIPTGSYQVRILANDGSELDRSEVDIMSGMPLVLAYGLTITSHGNGEDISDEIDCFVAYGDTDASASINAADMSGTAADYLWWDQGFWVAVFPALPLGTYTLTVQDSLGNSMQRTGLHAS
ncbi:MAG: hypothetical protein U0736_25335 [Gemmataceae bacterium]